MNNINNIIDIFDNKQVNRRFFDQFAQISSAELKNNRIMMRVVTIRAHGKNGPVRVIVPPMSWISKLMCIISDKENEYKLILPVEYLQKEGEMNLVLVSEKPNIKERPPIGAWTKLSDSAEISLENDEGRKLSAKWIKVNPARAKSGFVDP